MSLAFLTKIVAAFDFLAFFAFLFIDSGVNSFEKLKETAFKKLIPFSLGFMAPILLTSLYFLVTNNFKDFFSALLFSNVGYVGYANKLIIPQGLLYLKAILLAVFTLILYIKRKSIPRNILFVLVWLAFSLFNALFSQRPYTHYLLVVLPSFCLALCVIFAEKKRGVLGLIALSIVIIFISKNFNLNGRLLTYYVNLIDFCTGRKDVSGYQNFFDRNTSRDYELARYIRSHTNGSDGVFIWGNNAQIYKLSNKKPILRYTVAYHITNFKGAIEELDKAIETKKPKFIILMPNAAPYPLSLEKYEEKIDIQKAKIYEKVL